MLEHTTVMDFVVAVVVVVVSENKWKAVSKKSILCIVI